MWVSLGSSYLGPSVLSVPGCLFPSLSSESFQPYFHQIYFWHFFLFSRGSEYDFGCSFHSFSLYILRWNQNAKYFHFFSWGDHVHGRKKLPSQGPNPGHSNDLNHSSDEARSLTCWATRELQIFIIFAFSQICLIKSYLFPRQRSNDTSSTTKAFLYLTFQKGSLASQSTFWDPFNVNVTVLDVALEVPHMVVIF